MDGYPLATLLAVRRYREDAAARQVRARTQDLDLATATLAGAESDLYEYRGWRLNREEALFQEVKNQEICVADLDHLKQTILLLRQQQEVLEKEISAAKVARETARTSLAESQTAWKAAVGNTSKIREHRRRFMAAQKKEDERFQEKETEEFSVRDQPEEADDEDFK